jgi:hypothetical protein
VKGKEKEKVRGRNRRIGSVLRKRLDGWKILIKEKEKIKELKK